MINLENNSNRENDKKDYYEGIKSGVQKVFINDIYIRKNKFNEEEYDILIDLTINNRPFKYVKFTPFRLTHEMIYNPDKNHYQLTDVKNKIKQIIFNLYRKKNITTLKSSDLISAIDEIKQIGDIKGNAYVYLELSTTKTGYKYLSIPPAFKKDVVISSVYSDIQYTPVDKKTKEYNKKETTNAKEKTNTENIEDTINNKEQKVNPDTSLPF